MKLELETIPVWDGVQHNSECFICELMTEAQKDAINFYLGNSVMNPETRVRVNEHGFCPKHWRMLTAANKPQGVALMSDTYLETSRKKGEAAINGLLSAKSPKQAKKAVGAFHAVMDSREKGCLVCSSMEERLQRYLYTTCYLWGEDPAFREALSQGKGFCLHHFSLLLETAQKALSSSLYPEFVRELSKIEVASLDRIAKDVHWMTQKYKSENADKPWHGCEDAHKRTVDKMTGRSRVIDPVH
ncbi:hypothetical protein DYP60_10745 [Sphaerochaeta halotolerans]|jgi:hypothetical protein|uniref:ABC transporter substrate-binding protein n=1 Tax=Sphaerochaeta halotolerans TaxID=2293840 RepID=A0A372MG28_9SPIR|nr:DUF6062 family protein [Sphaerochaeta halotolerans]MDN5333836.1 hypothetical protein [Sphaerochaeta sp.]RFU94256.1 hypothetical protein DYP60_10745 [Sphaerochaeta halotolerans]